ncbi:MAG: hypothetical protein QNJ04_16870 [Desulfobacterales bacterium]|nr:hypothetical protein [Desulfobacterales bacterium]
MKPLHRLIGLAGLVAAMALLAACAAPITHPVRITYTGQAPIASERVGRAGLQMLEDGRGHEDAYWIGQRAVGAGSYERYVSSPDDLALSVSDALAELLQRKGLEVAQISGWDFTPEGMLARAGDRDYLIGGTIRRFNCEAEKKLVHTRVVMEIELELRLGRVGEKSVDRRPVDIRMERVAPKFGPDDFQRYINEILAQVLEKGLRDVP